MECMKIELDLVFVIDLTSNNAIDESFYCWIHQISLIIDFAFNLVQDITSCTNSLRIVITTFDAKTSTKLNL